MAACRAWVRCAAALSLLSLGKGAADIVERVCDPAGLALQPPECWAPS
eukprot:SAG22_NODE_9634_length_578_cov_1.066806_1_plen_47_part_10